MRRPRVVACKALIVVLAMVAVPGSIGLGAPSSLTADAPDLFTTVNVVASVHGPVTTVQPDPGARSNGTLDHGSILLEPSLRTEPPQARPDAAQPEAKAESVSRNPWRTDREISWYGPGLIGHGTACGKTLTRTLLGVAHRSLPCGTPVEVMYHGQALTVPVVDRGPFTHGIGYDLTSATAQALGMAGTSNVGVIPHRGEQMAPPPPFGSTGGVPSVP